MNTNKEKFISKVSSCDNDWVSENDFKLLNQEEIELRASIALMLRRYMIANDIKQIDLARQLSVSPQYVNKILRCRENLTLHTLVKIKSILKSHADLNNILLVKPKEESTIIFSEHQNISLENNPGISFVNFPQFQPIQQNVLYPRFVSSFKNGLEYSLN